MGGSIVTSPIHGGVSQHGVGGGRRGAFGDGGKRHVGFPTTALLLLRGIRRLTCHHSLSSRRPGSGAGMMADIPLFGGLIVGLTAYRRSPCSSCGRHGGEGEGRRKRNKGEWVCRERETDWIGAETKKKQRKNLNQFGLTAQVQLPTVVQTR